MFTDQALYDVSPTGAVKNTRWIIGNWSWSQSLPTDQRQMGIPCKFSELSSFTASWCLTAKTAELMSSFFIQSTINLLTNSNNQLFIQSFMIHFLCTYPIIYSFINCHMHQSICCFISDVFDLLVILPFQMTARLDMYAKLLSDAVKLDYKPLVVHQD